jgi:LysR family glycine cleavage system transcriptional activator
LYALQGFLGAARERNLSRAAAALHLTVSALSHQIRGLEERLGRRLFDRGPRGVRLTPDGERLFERIAPHLDAIEHALRPVGTRREDALTLSLMPSMASSWLLPRLPSFLAAHPQVELSLQSDVALVDFARDPVDAALRFGPGGWPGLVAEHLFDDWITPVASPALVERLGTPTLRTLGRFPLLGDPGARWPDWFARHGGTPPPRYAADFTDTETVHRAAVEGLGIALGRRTLARPLIEAGLLVAPFAEQLKSDYAHFLVYPPRSADLRALRVFRDWLLGQARAYAEGDPAMRGAAWVSPRRRTRG